MYRALIAAAGLSTRLQDLSEKRNKVLLDLGGDTLLGNLLTQLERADIRETFVAVGHDALAVRDVCAQRAVCVLNPFFLDYGILSSLWLARSTVEGHPFVFSTGDHYFTFPRLQR